MKTKISIILIVFILSLFMSGCFSSPSKRYFQINIDNTSIKNSNLRKIIFLKNIDVNEFYDDYRLVYRKSTHELNYYAYEFWTIKPGKLIKNAVINYLKNNESYNFIRKLTAYNPDYYIESKINVLEEVEKNNIRYGRLSMEFELYNFKSGKKLLTYNFDKKEKFQEKKIDYFPKTISNILQKQIDVLINKIKKMEKKNDKKN